MTFISGRKANYLAHDKLMLPLACHDIRGAHVLANNFGAVAARREKPTIVFKNKADADNSSIEKARALLHLEKR